MERNIKIGNTTTLDDPQIQTLELQTYKQNFKVTPTNKSKYGEVNTPFHLIYTMLDMLPAELFTDETVHWLDPACGCGYFPMVLYNRLNITLMDKIKYSDVRADHIIGQMLSMVEVNPEHIPGLRSLFGSKANILNCDFISLSPTLPLFNKYIPCESPSKNNIIDAMSNVTQRTRMVILGNPPYNSEGVKKVPTNTKQNKKTDGKTIWTDFVRHSIKAMHEGDFLMFIIPSIWMKPDRAKIYDLFMSYKLHRIRTFSNSETAKIFRYQAQTPTCIVVMEKTAPDFITEIYDAPTNTFIQHRLSVGRPIPLCNVAIINQLLTYVDTYGHLEVKKTNMPSKKNELLRISSDVDELHDDLKKQYPYRNIRTCCLVDNEPKIVYEYSSQPCSYYGKKKVVLAHKMYGYPTVDITGEFGISNRDNYVITDLNHDTDYELVKNYLDLPIIQKVYDSTRYRMRYLERYAFEFIPDVLNNQDLLYILKDLL